MLPPAGIAEELVRIGRHPYVARASSPLDQPGGKRIGDAELQQLFKMILGAKGVDFTHYKQTTLHRRIKRRMVVNGIEKFEDYVQFVKRMPGKVE